jgi:effector-binding domain-containing protein
MPVQTKGPDLSHQPQVQQRAAQHYAAIPMTVTMDTIPQAVDQAFPELFGWLAAQGLEAAGPPFIRYLVIDMAAELKIELAVPVGRPVAGSGRVQPGVLPEGRYAVLRHTGSYDGLFSANAALQRWAAEQGVTFDTWAAPDGAAWRGRIEQYITDPSKEPDPSKWETDVAYLIGEA